MPRNAMSLALSPVLLALLGAAQAGAPPATTRLTMPTTRAAGDGVVTVREVLTHAPTYKPVPGLPFSIDPLQADLARGTFSVAADWQHLAADAKGHFEHEHLEGGWAYTEVESDTDRVMLLRAAGHAMVYVNGEPRAGDVYSAGTMVLPVQLKKGKNTLLFQGGRGELSAKLEPVTHPVMIVADDATLPDLVESSFGPYLASVVVVNATPKDQKVQVTADTKDVFAIQYGTGKNATSISGEIKPASDQGDIVPAMTVRKLPLPLRVGNHWEKPAYRIPVFVTGGNTVDLSINVRKPEESRRVTRLSDIDSSVQYYAVRPALREPLGSATTKPTPLSDIFPDPDAKPLGDSSEAQLIRTVGDAFSAALFGGFPSRYNPDIRPGAPGIVLSLHGASVEAPNQANAYASKPDLHIVCPTNRRPYGFDWEEWGRLDALEVLAHAEATLPYDPARIYLTGHSMGGHGTYHLAVNYPGMFAVAAPSAGWVQWSTYAKARAAATQPATRPAIDAFRGASRASDTLALVHNLEPTAMFLLHGDADDNVPVTEERRMATALKPFHKDFAVHEEKGAGHWWDNHPDAPGADCVDYPAIFDLFAKRKLVPDAEVKHVAFTTPNPAVNAKLHWAEVLQQGRSGEYSAVDLTFDPAVAKLSGTTSNVATLALALPLPDSATDALDVAVRLDGQDFTLSVPRASGSAPSPATAPSKGNVLGKRIILARESPTGPWSLAPAPLPEQKNPARAGPLKLAFQHRFALVYATGGTPEENALSYRKARFDSESWLYRANATPDLLPDTDPSLLKDKDRTLVLYGNADSHKLWPELLASAPIQVSRTGALVGSAAYAGDLTSLFCVPRPGSDKAMIIAIASTTPLAARAHLRLTPMVSGVAWPDYAVINANSLTTGASAVEAAGFFTNTWQLP